MQKVGIPKGMRDFSPEEMSKRNYIFDTIKEVYRLYGYKQIETPSMENLSTLMGKYGEEGDKLLFKVLNSGDVLKDFSDEELLSKNSIKFASKACDKGLRYDLTVPLARYIVSNRDKITLPFKRFQIQPVWRADRPQKGRYREFYQCDADVIGSDSLLNEVELVQIIDTVFTRLGINVNIHINNRKILSGIAEHIGMADRIVDITIAIDKLDKIGKDKVIEELKSKGFTDETIINLDPIFSLEGSNYDKLEQLSDILKNNETGLKGIEEIRFILDKISKFDLQSNILIDFTLARGLSYYTGAIFEVKSRDVSIGSISGGGRYDNLTGIFGLDNISGVGISFGADRIYDVMQELNLFKKQNLRSTDLFFVNFGEREEDFILPLIYRLRSEGIAVEIYPESAKLKKQMNYANSLNIPYVAIVGENEINENKITLKDMSTGEQKLLDIDALIQMFSK